MSSYIEDFRQGNTKTLKLDYGQDVDITGWVFHFILKENLSDTSNIIRVAVAAGTDPRDDILNGLAYVVISSTVIDEVTVGNYYWSLQVDKGSTVIETILPPLDNPKDQVKVLNRMSIV